MKTLFVTLHHRRSLFYEEGVAKFLEAGYPLFIYHTGSDNGFGHFGLVHDLIEQREAPTQIPYDQGMQDLRTILQDKEWDTIVYLDNDIFFDDISYAEELIKQFNESDFGFCSFFENLYDYSPKYKFEGLIAEVIDQQFEKVDQPPYAFKPNPHWENAFMMFKRSLWEKLTPENFTNSREMIRAISNAKAKIGAHKREAKLVFSHEGKGWFHMGNLMKYYYILEQGLFNQLVDNSPIDCARMGYFVAQKAKYGDKIYTEHINENLHRAAALYGGESNTHVAWADLRGYLIT